MIVAAAIRRNGLIFTMPRPARHHTILNHMAQKEEIDAIDVEQGFLTNDGQYASREEAFVTARRCQQIDVDKSRSSGMSWGQRHLFSEDLW